MIVFSIIMIGGCLLIVIVRRSIKVVRWFKVTPNKMYNICIKFEKWKCRNDEILIGIGVIFMVIAIICMLLFFTGGSQESKLYLSILSFISSIIFVLSILIYYIDWRSLAIRFKDK